MKIVIISDTHTDSIDNLPGRVLDELSGADMIIHAGDFTGKRVLDALRKIGPFRGVYGNIDWLDVRKELPAIDVIQAGDFSIGVNHPAEGGSPLTLEHRLRPKFPGVQAIIHIVTVIGRRTIFGTVFSGSIPVAQLESFRLQRKLMGF